MTAFKVLLLAFGFLQLAYGQYMEQSVGPPMVPLPVGQLLSINGPLYVDASSLVPVNQMPGPPALGPPVPVGPPMLGPPVPVGPPMLGPPVAVGPPMLGPPMMNQLMGPPVGGFVQMAYDETNDPANERPVMASRRSANTNVQSGIQQFGTGNMNLQGNIQQIQQP